MSTTKKRPSKKTKKATKPGAAYHHGDLRSALLTAALDILREQGAQGLSLREVARRVDVSHQAPYRHFPDKEAMLAAIALEGFQRLQKSVDETLAKSGADPLLRLEDLAMNYVRFALANTEHLHIMLGGFFPERDKYPPLRDAAEATFEVIVQLVKTGQEQGLVRREDPERLALACWSSVHGIAALLMNDALKFMEIQPSNAEPIVRFIARKVIAGLRP